jgi:uncharacterized membrane protein
VSGPAAPDPSALDASLERTIGTLLRVGVGAATALAAVGGTLFLFRHGEEPAYYGVFHGAPQDLRSVGAVMRAVGELRGRAVIQLGLLLLIATPVARVALTLVAFARARDRAYVVITSIVLALLLVSLFGLPG